MEKVLVCEAERKNECFALNPTNTLAICIQKLVRKCCFLNSEVLLSALTQPLSIKLCEIENIRYHAVFDPRYFKQRAILSSAISSTSSFVHKPNCPHAILSTSYYSAAIMSAAIIVPAILSGHRVSVVLTGDFICLCLYQYHFFNPTSLGRRFSIMYPMI